MPLEAPGESRIPTVRRSALPRPTSATPSVLPLSPVQFKPGFSPLTPVHSQVTTSSHLFEAPGHLCSSSKVLRSSSPTSQPSLPRIRLPSSKISRFSDTEVAESPNRRAQRPVSGSGRLSYHTTESWSDEERLWGREAQEGSSIKSLRASTESSFSKQLAKITGSSNEDVSDLSLNFRVSTSIHGPRSCWEGPLHSVSSAEPTTSHLTRDSVGRRVVVGGVERGTLRYYGRTAFAGGDWCGIELERGVGKNDGSVDGVIYFSCRPGHGIFAPAGKVFLDLEHIVSDEAISINNKNSQGQVWQGFMPSSTHSQEANAVRRRPSDASSATFTIEGRDSSLPDSPESQGSLQQPHECTQAKRPSIQDDHEEVASLGSPEDATCDESSLGILTPDQMPDFTVTASASLGRSPSDEDVAALEDEVCDGDAPAGAAANIPANSQLLRWDSDPSALCVEELFKNDVSAIIRELRTSAEVSSSGESSPTRPHPSPETEQFQHDEEDMEALQKKEDEVHKSRNIAESKERLRKITLQDECHTIPELREVPAGVDLSRLPAMGRRVAPLTTRLLLAATSASDVPPEVEATWSNAAAAMTTSAGSLDQGYQGDAECDPRSEGGTGTASSPTEDVRLFHGVIDVERLTEADVSLADDEGEAEHHSGVAARDRSARIIDGKLYHSHRELGRAHDPHGSEMDSSGFYSDLDPRDRDAEDESTRTDLEPVQEAQGSSNMHDSLLDDPSHAQDDSTNHDHTFDDHSLKDELFDEKAGATVLDEEDRSSCSTLRPESKDLTPIEHQNRSPSPADNKCSPSPNNSSASADDVKVSPLTNSNTEGATTDNKLTDSGISVEGGEDGMKAPLPKARTYDKPWLSRPPPPKKKEEPRKPLQPPPPMPKKNVQSKLKALLEAQEPTPDEARRPRQPRKNRWDEVMNKIAEGQKDEKVRPKIKEVKSRLMDGLKTQAQLSPQAERIRQERRERRERRERQAVAAANAARRAIQARGDRKRSSASIRSNRTSRAPSLDSLPTDPTRPYSRGSTPEQSIASNKSNVDKLATTSRPVSPCPSDVSSSSDQSHSSNLSHVSSRLPIRALHVSGPAHVGSVNSLCSTASGEGGDSRASRDSRVLTANRVNISNGEKKRSEVSAPPRRPRLDNVKSTIPKPGRVPPRKFTDPVKAARPGGPTSGGPRGPHLGGHGGGNGGAPGQQERQQHPVPHAEQLRRLDAELTARATELKVARTEKDLVERRVEALTVLIHHLTNHYEPFLCPTLKAEVVRLNQQLTDTRLSLDESTAAVRRLQEEAAQSVEQHTQKVQELEKRHKETLEKLTKQHQHDLDLAIEKHRKELSQFAEDQQTQREDLSRAHTAEIERLEGEWRTKLDVQHEKHLCAVQELNTQHTHKLRELESSRQAREFELEETNHRLQSEQEALKIQSKKLEESLLNDTDHRLQAVRNMCSSLKSEVDSLKTVVEMKNSEIHTLRGQVAEMGRLSKELEIARDKAKSLQAKTEDLQAQMEKRALSERHLVNEHRLLMETCQREANINKRLSLENEELAWKLRQREEMYTSLPSSTLGFRCLFGGSRPDLVSRSPATPRRQEGASSPQAAPHSPRVAVRSPSGKISPSKCEVNKRRSRLGLSSEDGVNGDDRVQDVSIDSPPPSPCVKAVVEKSNSVSFILDLNDSQSDDSFLDLPPSPRPRPQRTASLSAADRPRTPIHARRVIHNNRANSLNRNGVHLEGRQNSKSELNGKRKEVNGKSHDSNGHGSQPSSGRSASESSEGGSEMERVSPTGLAWTVPVHPPKSPVKTSALRQNGSPIRGRVEHHLLEDPDEDEYEETPEGTHQFIEVVELSRVGLVSSSEAASDSELSQCDLIKGGSSTDSDSESSDGEPHTQQGPSNHHEQLARKNGPWCPKEGAGEAMITDDLLKQYPGDTLAIEPLPTRGKRPPRRCFPSAPSSDSDDNMNAHNEGTTVDVSWSEDITSSSEMHEL
ncbi:CAP-Gly domain-containing linker protein 1-like isoform X2 [Macrobrachium rosenbergii]|uniref:CAP-Gly domain-containing linker protein 1-like isoform X2 n=1 Tax=Macrobrachium rosenbergii TaxID=79674 RepID=UPI0034D43466